MATTDNAIDGDILDKMIEVRRAIHQFPELSNREAQTSALVRRELEAAGIGPIREVAGTGLIVDIAGPALRAAPWPSGPTSTPCRSPSGPACPSRRGTTA